MNISYSEESGIQIVNLDGRLDSFTSQIVNDKLDSLVSMGKYQFILNMDQVTYLSSAGIRILLALKKKSVKHKGDVKLAAVQTYPMSVLEISGCMMIFSFYDSVAEAVRDYMEDDKIKNGKSDNVIDHDINSQWKSPFPDP